MQKAVLCLALCLPPLFSVAQTSSGADTGNKAAVTEEHIKAVFLYKFLSYVEWPAQAFAKNDSPYLIGVINADGIADELSKISAGRRLNNRSITVKKLGAADGLTGIHVLFSGNTGTDNSLQALKRVQRQPVLAVTETEGALAHGSMINFRVVDDRVRFEVSLEPAEKSGLKISSRLLEVAISVTKGSQR